MDNTIKRNKLNARRIESWLLNRTNLKGSSHVAEAIGVDKSQITRWKQTWYPKISMLLAVLEYGVVDDDIARISKQVALYLEENILTNVRKKKSPTGKVEDSQISMEF